jgi:hypothetical protein
MSMTQTEYEALARGMASAVNPPQPTTLRLGALCDFSRCAGLIVPSVRVLVIAAHSQSADEVLLGFACGLRALGYSNILHLHCGFHQGFLELLELTMRVYIKDMAPEGDGYFP